MEPHDRDENEENILEDMIRGEDDASHFLNDSVEGDESLNRGGGVSNAWEEAEIGVSDEGEADKAEAGGSGATLINTSRQGRSRRLRQLSVHLLIASN